jgi:hypothetical protein
MRSLIVTRDDSSELLDKMWPLRARSDQAHFPAQDVQQLRYLVKPSGTNERTDPRHTRVSVGRPARTGNFGVYSHAAELQHRKYPAMQSDAALSIEHWSGRIDPNQEGYEQQKRHGEGEQQ